MTWALMVAVLGVGQGSSLSTNELDKFLSSELQARKACGPISVWYCLRRVGVNALFEDVLNGVNVKSDGTSLDELIHLLKSYGSSAKAVSFSDRDLGLVPVPSILVTNRSHCVVFEGYTPDGDQIRLFEPSELRVISVPSDQFLKHWTGEAILFESPSMSLASFLTTIALVAIITIISHRLILRLLLHDSEVAVSKAF